MTIDQLAAQIKKWAHYVVGLLLLLVVLCTALGVLGVAGAGVYGIPMTQGAGIAALGLAFLYSKLA